MSKITAAVQDNSRFSQRILVVVDQDMTTKIPRIIWSHEKPILELVHGEGKVEQVDHESMNEGYSAKVSPAMLPHNKKQDKIVPPSESSGLGFLFTGDPDVEYQRLAEAYGKMPEENILVVQAAYGRASERKFAKMMPRPKLTDMPEAQLRSLIRDYGVAPDAPAPAMTNEEKAEADAAFKKYTNASQPELAQMAQELGVEL